MLSIDQTNCMYSNDELGRVYENSLSKDPETGFFCAREWRHSSHIVKCIIPLKTSFLLHC